jgi:hypothetical protein
MIIGEIKPCNRRFHSLRQIFISRVMSKAVKIEMYTKKVNPQVLSMSVMGFLFYSIKYLQFSIYQRKDNT